MKPLFLSLTTLILSAGAAAQQSLGDVARQARSQQKPTATMTFDQDSMARPSGVISTVGHEKPEAAEQTDKSAEAKTQEAKGEAKDQDKDKDKDKDKKPPEKAKAEDWGKKIDDEKKEIATLQRELDILQREQRLRAAAFYGDAGTQMRDQAKFAQDSRQEQEQIDSKKQALDGAQQKLADLEEQARKAGAPSQ